MTHKKSSTGDVGVVVEREYQSREFCKDIRCTVQLDLNRLNPDSPEYEGTKDTCRKGCVYTRKHFYIWMIDHQYTLAGEGIESVCDADTAYDFHKWCQERKIRIVRRK